MGFWSSFFGAGAAHVYNEMKKEEKETQRWNDLFHEMMECESEFNDYLKSVGIIDNYCADVEYVNNGNITPIKREIENLRKKVNNYISLGGLGVCVRNIGSLDDDIDKVKYLKKVGKLERQVEFVYDDAYTVQSILEDEEKNAKQESEKIKQEEQYCENKLEEQVKKILFNLKSNDLKAVLLEKYEYNNSGDIKIDFVQILTEDIAKQWIKNDDVDLELNLLTVNLILTKNNIEMYDWVTNSQVYYRHTLTKNENILVEYTPFCDDSVSIVKFGDLFLYTSTDNAKKMCNIFKGCKKENLFYMEDINSLSGIEFEKVCQQLVENMGFETETTKASGDGGIDLIAYNHQPLLSGKYIIQCKRYTGSVGEPIIRDLYGVVMSERANKGILMTTGTFTKSAINFADGKPIELIDGAAMHSLLKQYGMIEKSFEEQKSDCMEEAAQKLEDILSMLNDDEYDPYDFTQEEKQILKEKEQLFEKNRVKENEKLLATEEVKIFKNSLTIAENRDKYKVSSEILNHYIEHINCIFQIVTDQTSLSECDMNGNIKNTFKGTIFYFINAKENIATIGDIVNRNIPISLDFSCQQGAKFISFSMDVSSDFVISSDTLKKSITISNKKSKINLSLPFGDDYRNAYDYLYILKNTNNVMR